MKDLAFIEYNYILMSSYNYFGLEGNVEGNRLTGSPVWTSNALNLALCEHD